MKSIAFVVAALAALAGCNDRSAKEGTSHPAGGTQSGTVGANDTVAPEPSHSTATLEPAQGSESAAMPPAPDHRDADQRGSVLTEQGPLTPEKSATAQGSSSGSLSGSAEGDSARSLHLPSSGNDHSGPAIGGQTVERSVESNRVDSGDATGSASDTSGTIGGSTSGTIGGSSSGIAPDYSARDSATLGQSVDDEALVKRIHQSLVDDETLSHDARSVQIVPQDGMLLLKGTVGSDRERARISDTAFRESGGRMVINQIEVQQQP